MLNDIKLKNLQKANERSHRLIVDCLREALYCLLEKKNISEITVSELTETAGVSRGGFYKNFYLVTDVLEDDIKNVANDVRIAMGSDIGINWEIILQAAYRYKEKIPLILKAGMGMQILTELNRSVDAFDERFRLRITAWNGIIFNCILDWSERGFTQTPRELAAELTKFTLPLYDKEVAATFKKPKA